LNPNGRTRGSRSKHVFPDFIIILSGSLQEGSRVLNAPENPAAPATDIDLTNFLLDTMMVQFVKLFYMASPENYNPLIFQGFRYS
jgi:hypothetical protein